MAARYRGSWLSWAKPVRATNPGNTSCSSWLLTSFSALISARLVVPFSCFSIRRVLARMRSTTAVTVKTVSISSARTCS